VIRAFIAVELDPLVIGKISEAIEQLKGRIDGIRWVPAGNLHVTLKFLAWIDEGLVHQITSNLDEHLRLFSPFIISAKGLGTFPNPRRPHVLWVGLEGTRLGVLAAAVERALDPLGFSPEKRAFQPHLTIARWRESQKASPGLAEELTRWSERDFGNSKVKSVTLFQSILKPQGAEYRALQHIFLGRDHIPDDSSRPRRHS
jgi:2'-5' RNA ligase